MPKPTFKQKIMPKNFDCICTRGDVHNKPECMWASNTYCRTRVKPSLSTFILVKLSGRMATRTSSGMTHMVAQNKPHMTLYLDLVCMLYGRANVTHDINCKQVTSTFLNIYSLLTVIE